ncbi:hypothetical protein MA16_Dca004803 [Dendrobium catenatum]|uniref:Uncharacterized protein n=1 Tax=Dendrobium catenatum TaxID=906689 RepID=A0A2I0VP46_9ASPA|nr:hypothetical protein MA16_Dca004803 [Dendrobium catenatum]
MLQEFPIISLWIKIKNLPLSCWTPEGISKIACCVGVPLAVDELTLIKTRLTFARVCIQVNNSSPLPDEIFISVDGKITPLTVLYDWIPNPCTHCGSINHSPTSCPKNTNTTNTTAQHDNRPRGRSSSHKPRFTPPPLGLMFPNLLFL